MTEKKKSVFETLSAIDVSDHLDVIKMKKGPALSYVSWSWAWSMLQNVYPDTPTPVYTKFPEMILQTKRESYQVTRYGKQYTQYRTVVTGHELTGREVPYLNTPTGTMVECTVTIDGHNYTESLYVMDNANNAVINPTMQQINKTQKRCLVKTLALAGLGLNIYAGEDLPMGDVNQQDKQQQKQKAEKAKFNTYRQLYSKYVADISQLTGQNADAVNTVIGSQLKTQDEFINANIVDKMRLSSEFAAKMLKETKESKKKQAQEVAND